MKEKISKMLKSYFFDGFLLIALGVVMIVWPKQSLSILCDIIGAVIIVMGLIKLITFFAGKKEEKEAKDLLVGIIQLALGTALIVKADFFITAFQIITAIILAYGAIVMLCHAIALRKIKGPMFVLSIIFGIITLVLAVIIFIDPAAFAEFKTQLHGISLIVEGLAMIIVLSKVKDEKTNVLAEKESKK